MEFVNPIATLKIMSRLPVRMLVSLNHELLDKTIGIVGLGRIGKEVAIRARAFGMNPIGYDVYWDEKFAAAHQVKRVATLDEIYAASDYISLHVQGITGRK